MVCWFRETQHQHNHQSKKSQFCCCCVWVWERKKSPKESEINKAHDFVRMRAHVHTKHSSFGIMQIFMQQYLNRCMCVSLFFSMFPSHFLCFTVLCMKFFIAQNRKKRHENNISTYTHTQMASCLWIIIFTFLSYFFRFPVWLLIFISPLP